jgi:hypothetical protein
MMDNRHQSGTTHSLISAANPAAREVNLSGLLHDFLDAIQSHFPPMVVATDVQVSGKEVKLSIVVDADTARRLSFRGMAEARRRDDQGCVQIDLIGAIGPDGDLHAIHEPGPVCTCGEDDSVIALPHKSGCPKYGE